MKSKAASVVRYNQAIESVSDVDKTRAYKMALSRLMRGGEQVLDCGTGTGSLAIAAIKEGAKFVTAVDKDVVLADLATCNVKYSGCEERIRVVCGDAASQKIYADIVVIDILDTMLIYDEQVKVINALVSKRVINNKTKVVPQKASLFFEPVQYDFDFSDCHMPMIVPSRNEDTDSRCVETLGNAILYREVSLKERVDTKVAYIGRHIIHTKGWLNALKFSSVVHLTEDFMIGTTASLNRPVFVPVHEVYVNPGDVLTVQINYILGHGFENLKINII
jgi:predicted RNA methylase